MYEKLKIRPYQSEGHKAVKLKKEAQPIDESIAPRNRV
jgi:hypothetical protein